MVPNIINCLVHNRVCPVRLLCTGAPVPYQVRILLEFSETLLHGNCKFLPVTIPSFLTYAEVEAFICLAAELGHITASGPRRASPGHARLDRTLLQKRHSCKLEEANQIGKGRGRGNTYHSTPLTPPLHRQPPVGTQAASGY